MGILEIRMSERKDTFFKILFITLLFTFASCGSSKRINKAKLERSQQITNIVNYSKVYLGTPYQFGGMSPYGMDCSGLLHLSFSRYGIDLPRTVEELTQTGESIRLKKVDVGDLIFFKTQKKTRKSSHVGLVVNKTKETVEFIHSSTSQGVMISSLNNAYWAKNYTRSRRVIN